ncbi:MAG: Fe-S cluster assembly ATPase SufC [Alistipes sp.]|jgi:Fe-S cluster assembly ATP-binding protein|nr:Fe-S cluster assembly ATPase SufC [Alistipes sp.]
MLEIKDLHASVAGGGRNGDGEQKGAREILHGLSLSVGAGEVHAIMGPNGSGKSTLASVLAGNPRFFVTGGEMLLDGRNIAELSIEERAREGLFLGFQYPVEIPGVSMAAFMKAAMAEKRKHEGLDPLSAAEFLKLSREKAALVGLDPAMLSRSVNEGFSGGEKKKNEIFQMAMLEPRVAFLDETDSGLDIDALRIVGEGVSKLRRPDNAIVLITHHQRLLDYIVPDFVHVLYKGRIIASGDRTLALKLEKEGYDELISRS